MNKTLAISILLAGVLAVPVAAMAEDSDADRSNPKAFVKDSAITTAVKAQLAAKHINSLGNISVDTDMDGIVWLSGTAHTQDAIDQAISITRATEGVKSVHSTLTVKKDD
ncbi:MAG: BON domain-containing protein [Steroidobacteraceae bacterium]|nr:BON domain-containing protein [Steroidobacteraceae bacterium]